MADQIVNCKTFKEGTTIKYHEVSYLLDSGEAFQIYIDASEMTDPSDSTELKTLANSKAADVKSDLVATPLNENIDSGLNGDVTL